VTSYDNNARSQCGTFREPSERPAISITTSDIIGNDDGIKNNSWFVGDNGTTNNRTCTARDYLPTYLMLVGFARMPRAISVQYALAGAAHLGAKQIRFVTPTAAELVSNADAYQVKSFPGGRQRR